MGSSKNHPHEQSLHSKAAESKTMENSALSPSYLGTAESGASSAVFTGSDAAEIKASDLYKNYVYKDIKSFETSSLGASYPATRYTFDSGNDPDEAFGLHSLMFSTVSGSVINIGGSWTYTATVNLTKNWSFANYGSGGVAYSTSATFNSVGYRLQYYGYIAPFTLVGSFTDTWNE